MWGIFILLTVAGVILWIASFKDIDTIPATTMDYQPLEEQAIAIQQNPQLLFKTNCEVEIDSDFITVTLENKIVNSSPNIIKILKSFHLPKRISLCFGFWHCFYHLSWLAWNFMVYV